MEEIKQLLAKEIGEGGSETMDCSSDHINEHAEEMEEEEPSTSPQDQEAVQPPSVIQPAENEEPVDERISAAALQLSEQLDRIHTLGAQSTNPEGFLRGLNRLVQRLRHVKNEAQAVSQMFVISKAACQFTKRCQRMNVQSDSIRRRLKNAPKCSGRIPAGRPRAPPKEPSQSSEPPKAVSKKKRTAPKCSKSSGGRPPKAATLSKIAKRRPHKLSLAIKQNIAPIMSHGKR